NRGFACTAFRRGNRGGEERGGASEAVFEAKSLRRAFFPFSVRRRTRCGSPRIREEARSRAGHYRSFCHWLCARLLDSAPGLLDERKSAVVAGGGARSLKAATRGKTKGRRVEPL